MDATRTNLAKALAAAQADLRNPACDSVNGHFSGSRYASLAAIIDSVRPVLAAHGLGIIQGIEGTADGVLVLETKLFHSSGESWEYRTAFKVTGNIQQFCGAITYLRRYAICAMLNIVGDDDLDAEDVVRPKPSKSQTAARQKPATAEVTNFVPEGYEEITPVQVTMKTAKTGKPYWLVSFQRKDGIHDEGSTFSETIGARLEAAVRECQSISVLISAKEKGGKVWKDIRDAI